MNRMLNAELEVIKMKKKTLGGIALVAIVLLLAGSAFAFRGIEEQMQRKPNFSPEIREQLQAAIEARDYAAWVAVHENNDFPMKGRIFEMVTADNFEQFAEMHEAMKSHDIETAKQIREELGMQCGKGWGMGRFGHGFGKMRGSMNGDAKCGCERNNTKAE
ncbi:MAG: hypothetical protein JW772_03440 [Candidatus Diapherotrites archaeon]|nr:hypothetical protein [Candidatus Diapherotrites archaeon]